MSKGSDIVVLYKVDLSGSYLINPSYQVVLNSCLESVE